MEEWNVLKRMKSQEQPVTLDFSTKENLELILGIYGGEDVCRCSIPGCYSNIMFTAKEHGAGRGLDYQTALQTNSKAVMQDGICLMYPHYNKEKEAVVFRGDTALWEPVYVDQFLTVYEEDGTRLLMERSSTPHSKQPVIEGSVKEGALPERFTVVYCALWEEKTEERENHALMKGQLFIRQFTKAEIMGVAVTSFRMTDPGHKNTAEPNPVVVVYNRRGWVQSYDYDYLEAIVEGKQKTFLEVSGEVEFKPSVSIAEVLYKKILLKLNCDYGTAVYRLKERAWDKIFKKERKGDHDVLHINFEKDWCVEIPSRRLPIKDMVKFYMEIPVLFMDGSQCSLVADTSLTGQTGTNEVKMPYLQLLWGCVKAGTSVMMACGESRRVEVLCIGDVVMSEAGGCMRVSNIYKGWNEELLCIETERGHSLICTEDHVVKTATGMKTVGTLCAEDILYDRDGEVKVTALYPAGEGEVYNVELDKSSGEDRQGLWICEGLINGDFMEQNRCHVRAERPTDQELIGWRESEFKNQLFREENHD